ncbi:MAG: hypothetical protein QGG25_04980 [Phycisphaerae bacterium]|jgi:hypothetical protein|nr:hypothetical protein [Phycisphaerae bacterium]
MVAPKSKIRRLAGGFLSVLWVLRTIILVILCISPPGLFVILLVTELRDKKEAEALQLEHERILRTIEGQEFFCYTSRQRSRDWVESNVLPQLAEDVQVIFLDGKTPKCPLPQHFISYALRHLDNVGFPNVMIAANGKMLDASLHHELYNAINQNLPPEQFMEHLNAAQEELRTEAARSTRQIDKLQKASPTGGN